MKRYCKYVTLLGFAHITTERMDNNEGLLMNLECVVDVSMNDALVPVISEEGS